MDGRTLLGALIRFFGFGAAALQVLQLFQQLVQLIGIAQVAASQPGAQDAAAAAAAAAKQAVIPVLLALILFAVGLLILKGGDAIATWAYSPRRGRIAPPAGDSASAKPAARKPASKPIE
ncbi:MAG TPA: hypothetical protein VGL66_04515 [Caulobacteraceae bacterium]|jgi:hypothetical protein